MEDKVPKTTKKPNKSGNKAHRPSLEEGKKIDKICLQLFQEGYSAYGVYLKTGMEMKTVLPRYHKWLDQLEDKSDFIQRQIDAKTSYLAKLDYARGKHKELYDFLEDKIKNAKKVSKTLLRDRSSALGLLNSVDRQIFDLETTPVLHDKLEEYINNKLQESQKEVIEVGIKNEIQQQH